MLTLLFILSIFIILYVFRKNYNYWKNKKVQGPKPTFFVGNLLKACLFKAQPGEIYTQTYSDFKNDKVVGLFRFFTPILLIRDPEIIREVTTRSFSNFHDNDIILDKKADPLIGRNPFFLKGEEWKSVRGLLTAGFTSGKMKWIYPYLENNSKKMIKFLENLDCLDAKGLCTRFTLSNVADAVFGVDARCFQEENSEFSQIAKEFLAPESWSIFVLFLTTMCPSITNFLSFRLCPKNVEDKLVSIVADSLKYRKENKLVRNDFLHILNEIHENSNEDFKEIDVVAHAAGFFADGYETSSLIMSYVLFELSKNLDVQEKLRKEVVEAFENNSNQMPYEALSNLSYLDAVLSESLRLHPATFHLQKICTQDFLLSLDEATVIEKGTPVILPIYGLHHDPKFFPDPEAFNPDRFLGKNKETIKRYTFLPFGEGPRACLGQRFGILQIKVGIVYIVKNFILNLNHKTKLPLKYDPTNFVLSPVGGLWIDFKKL